MSTISNRHQVNPFIAGKSEPLTGQRLAKIGYKKTAKIQNPLPSVCVSVPMIDVKEQITDFTPWFPHIRALMENAQDGIIRAMYESSGGQLGTISDDEIGIASMLAFLDQEANGGRMSKEFLVNWFNTNCQENLTVILAEKLGFEELNEAQMETIGKHVNAYRELFGTLAGGRTMLTEVQIKSLQRMLEICSVDDEVSKKMEKRLDEMGKKEKMEDLLEL